MSNNNIVKYNDQSIKKPLDIEAFITPYFYGKKTHKNWIKALDVAWHMSFHVDGYFNRPWMGAMEKGRLGAQGGITTKNMPANPYFTHLIDFRRPSESSYIRNYRRQIYKPFTKTIIGAVINSLQKIFKAEDFQTPNYKDTEIPSILNKETDLENYCEIDYPYFDSITNWAEKVLLNQMIKDPNALCVVMPISYDILNTDMVRPYSHIIPSKDLYEYKENEFAVFLSPYTNTYLDDKQEEKNGRIVCYVTTDCFHEARQNGEDSFELVSHYHNIGTLPAFLLGGEVTSPDGIVPFYESFLSPMLPTLDELAACVSDKQAELIQHMYSEKWYILTQICQTCRGTGKGVLTAGKQQVCVKCNGIGAEAKSPFSGDHMINNKNMVGQEQNVPIPPAGYITKDTSIIKYIDSNIEALTKSSFSAVNMLFLYENAQSKEKESGMSKQYDQQETNNFVYKVAYTLVNRIRDVYYYTNELRYSGVPGLENPETRKLMLPTINTPKSFDIVTSQSIEDKLVTLSSTTTTISPFIRQMAEADYVNRQYSQTNVRDQLILKQLHDPFAFLSSEEKMAMENSDSVDKIDLILSTYIDTFIKQQLNNDTTFIDKEFNDQQEVFYEMAQEKMDAITASKQAAMGGTASGGTMSMVNMVTGEVIVQPNNANVLNEINEVPEKQKNAQSGKDEKPSKQERNDIEFS